MNILAIGSHPDDIELGCGGTLVQHVASGDDVTMLVMTYGERGPGTIADREREQQASCDTLGVSRLIWGHLPDLEVSNHDRECVTIIEKALRDHSIDRIYTHGMHDTHQDHRAVALDTLGAARKFTQVLFYDGPSSFDFVPTIFVDITETIDKKIDALQCHASQVAASEKVRPEAVRGAALHRGHQSLTGAAEGFAPHRFVMSI